MADDVKPTDATTLLTKIAKKAGRGVEDVRSILARHGVAYKPSIAVPKHLCITSLAFTGKKKGETAPGPVNFTWGDLSPGLRAIISDRNFRGKTTLLGLMRWGLTGRRGKRIPTEFAETFHTLTMAFTLDGQVYEVEVIDAIDPVGTLWRVDGGSRLALDTFSSAEGFEAVMSGFFMGQLGLQMLVTHADLGDKGVDQPHDWVWLSGALEIEPDPDNLFGSYQALGSRMMQMYLGVPWTNAVNDVQAAKTRIDIEARQAVSELERTRERRKSRIEEIDAEIAGLRRKLRGLPSAEGQRGDLAEANRRFAEAQGRLRSAVRSMAVASEDREAAKLAYDAARRDLREFKEGRAAKTVFRSLDPVCCPRCDEVFDEERKQANNQDHTCVVCGTLEQPEGNPARQEAGLKDAVADAEARLTSQERRKAALAKAMDGARAEMRETEATARDLEAALAEPSSAYPLELELARLEARKEELGVDDAKPSESGDDHQVLRIAERVTQAAFKPLQDELLGEVSGLIEEYAVRFGVVSLEEAKLLGNTNLNMRKNGGIAWFGTQTPGEKARLKIAATIAIIKVAERRGLGRHPGVLLIDSPGSNEMVDRDYSNLIAGLAEVAREIPHLQVFVTAAASETILGHVARERLLYAEGDRYLW
ncbi:hypothetical protein [Methylorubrum thiocyanatum]|uniref:Large ATP-binding protein n=1 Tax=Methylorubrum thiocyanatum TaxID=47958 RepID=A0AA40S4X6_9HYPH|nr:hypothetical protein [Methylorubrum thiocyanatum]MBA8914646.1 hypothetical protein [Methylorubrum thiocyanatum]GJE81748.1 hypothetical protein CJNNKLLH_3102 [Methylorubrum thiocyanatum]